MSEPSATGYYLVHSCSYPDDCHEQCDGVCVWASSVPEAVSNARGKTNSPEEAIAEPNRDGNLGHFHRPQWQAPAKLKAIHFELTTTRSSEHPEAWCSRTNLDNSESHAAIAMDNAAKALEKADT